MHKKHVATLAIACCYLALLLITYSQTGPPSASEIGTQIQSYWGSSSFSELRNYVINLSTNYPNYVPAILAYATYQGICENSPSNFLGGIKRVINADVGTDYFKALLSAEKHETESLMEVYYREGTSHADLTNMASPQAIRSKLSNWPLELITNAPSIFLPNN